MKIGVVLPQTEIGNDPGAIKAYAEAVEDMGFTHILVFDHVLGANPERPGGWKGPYTYRHAFHEPFVLFGFLAAATRRVGLVTGIVILPQRQTALVAKQAAAVDVLSGGRLRLGVGVGWNPVEFEALGEDFHTRGRRVEAGGRLVEKYYPGIEEKRPGQTHPFLHASRQLLGIGVFKTVQAHPVQQVQGPRRPEFFRRAVSFQGYLDILQHRQLQVSSGVPACY